VRPRALFDGLEGWWDVSPRGEFLVTLEPPDRPRLHLVVNWVEELREKLP
jgi:hypothetical protein